MALDQFFNAKKEGYTVRNKASDLRNEDPERQKYNEALKSQFGLSTAFCPTI